MNTIQSKQDKNQNKISSEFCVKLKPIELNLDLKAIHPIIGIS